jgi:hypothetical protein
LAEAITVGRARNRGVSVGEVARAALGASEEAATAAAVAARKSRREGEFFDDPVVT